MSFTVDDFSDLTRLLSEHPEWRVELRSFLLTDDFLALPAEVRELAESHRRGEERLARLEVAVQELVEQVKLLVENQKRRRDQAGEAKGYMLELAYKERFWSYFGYYLGHPRVIDFSELEDALVERLPVANLKDVFDIDLIVAGEIRTRFDLKEIWLTVEVSAVVDRNDVIRAEQRARLLHEAGYPSMPVAAGEKATEGAEQEAEARNVVLMHDGKVKFWTRATEVWGGRTRRACNLERNGISPFRAF